MTKTLTFLHTAPVHIATFDRLMQELEPSIPVRHIVDETLLQAARAAGIMTPELAQRVTDTVLAAFNDGAAVVVCTCSTIAGSAEQARAYTDQPIMRIDRAMAEQAIAFGSRIVVVAALATTLEPTRQLLVEVAQAADKEIEVLEVVCQTAWQAFEAGNQAQYLAQIAATLRQVAPRGDVIVLAQASMADAVKLWPDSSIPILTSPRLGVEAAVQAYANA